MEARPQDKQKILVFLNNHGWSVVSKIKRATNMSDRQLKPAIEELEEQEYIMKGTAKEHGFPTSTGYACKLTSTGVEKAKIIIDYRDEMKKSGLGEKPKV